MSKLNFKLLAWILFYLLIFSFLINNTYKHLDADLGWHLEVGSRIMEEKSVPSFDHYNYTLAGEKWVDHEWLMNLVMHLIYNNFGYLFLTIFFALIIIITLIILKRFTEKHFVGRGQGMFLIMFFQFLGVSAMSPHLGIRIQEISLLFLALLLFIAKDYGSTKNYKKLFWLFPLFFVWANMHAGFLIGIFILFLWAGTKIFILIVNKIKSLRLLELSGGQAPKEIIVFLLFAFAALAITIINPYGIKLYSFLSGYTNDHYLTIIKEWMPVYYFPIQYKQIIYSAIITSMLVIFFLDLVGSYRKKGIIRINPWQIGLIILFLYLAFKSKRHFPLFFIVSFPWLMVSIFQNFYLPDNIKKFFRFGNILRSFILVSMLVVSFRYLVLANYSSDPFRSPYFCSIFPCRAIDYIKNDPEIKDKKLFNNYGWGGFMIHVWPEKKLFIDGRLPFYEFAGHTLLEEYLEFFKEEAVEEKLKLYNIELVLLRKYQNVKLSKFDSVFFGLNQKKINEQKQDLQDYLQNSSEWKLVYEDKISAVYVKQ